jgi:hypothetical protein
MHEQKYENTNEEGDTDDAHTLIAVMNIQDLRANAMFRTSYNSTPMYAIGCTTRKKCRRGGAYYAPEAPAMRS